ncbi:MAG: UvrD-helicase domain-containing protein [Thermoplasmatota archaeon]
MELTDRQMEALDTSRDIAVTAGAGSGKTRILVDRYITILRREPGIGPRNILALTFTEKAASEMKDRVRREIRKLASVEGGRWFDILEELEQADISTIHSFCTRIVRTLPVQAGVDPDFRVISETEASEMLKDVLNEVFTVAGPETPSLRRLLVDFSMNQTVSMLKGLLRESGKSSLRIDSREFEEISISHLESCLTENLEDAMGDIGTVAVSLEDLRSMTAPPVEKDRAVALIRSMEGLLTPGMSHGQLMSSLYLNRDLFLTKSGGERRSTNLGSLGVWKGDLGRIREIFSNIFSFVFNHRYVLPFAFDGSMSMRASERVSDLLTVYKKIHQLFAETKRENNGLDFNDMIFLAMDLLESNEEGLLESLRIRYRHLLVDEFQDTDPAQWRLVDLLWDGGTRCRLFIVGDPKQSIYGFRSADVRLFLGAQERLYAQDAGSRVVLDRNFRSRSEIMDLVNGMFPGIMEEGSDKWGVPFDPLEAHRMSGGSVTLLGVLGAYGSERREGEQAGRIIRRAVGNWMVGTDGEERPLEYSDIAILVPTRKGFNHYEEGLRTNDIPFQVYKGKGFFERQEVADVLVLLSFVTNPNDDLALASLLKGPFFGLSDEDLFRISLQDGSSFFDKLGSMGGEFQDDRSLLQNFIELSGALPPHMALRNMLEMSCVYASAGGRREGRNLDRVIEWAMQESSARTMFELAERLRRLIEEPPKEGEPSLSAEEDSVTMMTIHSAKGLEWPMVMVLGMNHEGGGGWGDTYLLDPDNGVSMKVADHSTGELVKTPSWIRAEEERSEKESEERKRLLYVAMTRAKDHLVLSGMVPVRKDGIELTPRGMFGLVWNALDLSVADLDEGERTLNGVKISLVAVRPEEIAEEEGTDEFPYLEASLPDDAVELPLLKKVPSTGHTFLLSPSRLIKGMDPRGLPSICPGSFSDIPSDEFGDMVHSILQGLPLKRVLGEYGWSGREDQVMDAVAEVDRVLGGFDEEMSCHELEVVGLLDSEGTVVPVLGRMDLLLKLKDGGFVIIDFKTGAPKTSHEKQLLSYKRILEGLIDGGITTHVIYSSPHEK